MGVGNDVLRSPLPPMVKKCKKKVNGGGGEVLCWPMPGIAVREKGKHYLNWALVAMVQLTSQS